MVALAQEASLTTVWQEATFREHRRAAEALCKEFSPSSNDDDNEEDHTDTDDNGNDNADFVGQGFRRINQDV